MYAGSVHSCALGLDGVAYSFGKHEYTGHGASSDVLEPRALDLAFGGRAVRETRRDGFGGILLLNF